VYIQSITSLLGQTGYRERAVMAQGATQDSLERQATVVQRV